MSTEKKYSCPRCGYFDPDIAPVTVLDEKPSAAASAQAASPETQAVETVPAAVPAAPAVSDTPTTVTATIAGQEVQIAADAVVEHDGQAETAADVVAVEA